MSQLRRIKTLVTAKMFGLGLRLGVLVDVVVVRLVIMPAMVQLPVAGHPAADPAHA